MDFLRRRTLLITCAAAPLFGLQAYSSQSPEAGTKVRVRTIAAQTVEGILVSLTQDGGLVLDVDREPQRLDLADLISVARPGTDPNSNRDQWWDPSMGRDGVAVEMATGDRVLGRIGEAVGENLAVEAQTWGNLKIPLERVSRLVFYSGATPAHADSLQWFARESGASDDRVLLTNGDVARGFLTGLDREGVRLEVDGKERMIPLRLAVAARLVHPPPQTTPGLQTVVSLTDGQRLTLTGLNWSGGVVRAMTLAGESVELPAQSVQSVEFFGGRWEWLSAKSPSRAEHVPMLSTEWKHAVDRNVLGGPLRVAGVRYERGIGVHSKSVLEYDLGGACKEFVTSFGIDDDSGRAANVRVVVAVDGQQRFERSDVVRGVLHGPLRVDVSGAKKLELIVDFGKNGDILDRFDWIEPGLIR